MEEQVIDIAPLLAAVVKEAGGMLPIKIETITGLDPDTEELAISPTEDGESLVLYLSSVTEVTDE